ncbi:MAG TPA: IS66 family transposase [Ktedonobacteraceae bacterium]
MTQEEANQLREEKRALQEQVRLLQEQIDTLQETSHVQEEVIGELQETKRLQGEVIRALQQQLGLQEQEIGLLKQQVQGLQERLKKDSHNSHLPPSSDRFGRQPRSLRKKSGKKAGGQEGHAGNTLHLSETPDEVIVHAVERCGACQRDLRGVASQAVERRQVVDLPPKRLVITEHQAEHKVCPSCQQVTQAAFPEEVRAPVQYGPAFGAVAVYLVQQQLLPYERACEVMQDLLGPTMSVGTVQALVHRCAEQLVPVEERLKDALRQAEVLHQDETGLYVAGKRHWMHVSATEQLTHYQVHAKRGKEALDEIGILADFHGVSVHDGWQSYWQYACDHALCNVHHLRELTFLSEEQQQVWADQMITLLLDIKAALEQARAQGRTSLHPLEVQDWKSQYEALLDEGYQANPPDPPPVIKKGRRKQSAARNLLDRLSTYQDAVLAFLDNFAVPFDNSLAERDIRMVKLQQKISGCFRSLPGAQAFCRIRGYLSTLRKQGLPVLSALEQALCGHPIFPAF